MAPFTVADLINQGSRQLETAGVDSPHFDASNILADVLQVELSHIPVMRNRPVAEEFEGLFTERITRRASREPLPYVTGDTEFYGLSFNCDCRAMVPRPETETLIATVVEHLSRSTDKPTVADIGTGTGIIAISLAHALPGADIYATDISAPALALARENVTKHNLSHCITLLPPGPYLQPLRSAGVARDISVLISNPPYVRTAQIDHLQAEIRHFEPRIALDGGPDGLDFYRVLLSQCSQLPRLKLLALEVGQGQAQAVTRLISQHLSSARIETSPDLAGLVRVVVAII